MAISPQRLTIYLYSAYRAVIFAIAQLSCCVCIFPCRITNRLVIILKDAERYTCVVVCCQITVDECMNALSETRWDIHNSIKLIKLSQLINTGVADKETCKQALMSCQWNVEDAATFLLTGDTAGV